MRHQNRQQKTPMQKTAAEEHWTSRTSQYQKRCQVSYESMLQQQQSICD